MSESPGRPAGDAYDWVQRARALHEAGNPAAAAELLAHAAAEEPAARSVREAWARALFDARRYDQAAREFLVLVELAPDDHYAHFGAGLALWRQQRFSRAAEHLTMAVAMRPGRAEYVAAQRQVRATIDARAAAGLPSDGPVPGTSDADDLAVGVPPPVTDGPLTGQALTRLHDGFLLDLDGVVYRGARALPHASAALSAARAQGVRLAFVTNNAARPPEQVAEHLRSLGIEAGPSDVATSAQAGARLVRERVPSGAAVLAVGGPGVAAALEAEGLRPVSADAGADATREVAAVLMGFGPDVSWRDLAVASYAVTAGAAFLATNTDLTVPTADGIAPGNGALVHAVRTATGVEPVVAGKPFPALTSYALERIAVQRPLVVGDRLDTDIEGAHALGLPSLLVLTGVTGAAELLGARPEQRPTYVAADLRGLHARGRRPSNDAAVGLDAAGDLTWGDLRSDAAGPDPLARLRAAAATCWAAADAGVEVRPSPATLDLLGADVARATAG